mmetsp:Transcript_17492/g.47912  ORF Transcript_17492/g.47912 Transcript_17492/m.47912 type:complete len:472 (-) Transcript_17492:346-1761(-)
MHFSAHVAEVMVGDLEVVLVKPEALWRFTGQHGLWPRQVDNTLPTSARGYATKQLCEVQLLLWFGVNHEVLDAGKLFQALFPSREHVQAILIQKGAQARIAEGQHVKRGPHRLRVPAVIGHLRRDCHSKLDVAADTFSPSLDVGGIRDGREAGAGALEPCRDRGEDVRVDHTDDLLVSKLGERYQAAGELFAAGRNARLLLKRCQALLLAEGLQARQSHVAEAKELVRGAWNRWQLRELLHGRGIRQIAHPFEHIVGICDARLRREKLPAQTVRVRRRVTSGIVRHRLHVFLWHDEEPSQAFPAKLHQQSRWFRLIHSAGGQLPTSGRYRGTTDDHDRSRTVRLGARPRESAQDAMVVHAVVLRKKVAQLLEVLRTEHRFIRLVGILISRRKLFEAQRRQGRREVDRSFRRKGHQTVVDMLTHGGRPACSVDSQLQRVRRQAAPVLHGDVLQGRTQTLPVVRHIPLDRHER